MTDDSVTRALAAADAGYARARAAVPLTLDEQARVVYAADKWSSEPFDEYIGDLFDVVAAIAQERTLAVLDAASERAGDLALRPDAASEPADTT